MKGIKKCILIFTVILLLQPSSLTFASSIHSGDTPSKEEVVYGKLNASGEPKELYVVNSFDIEKQEKVIDYGSYSSVKNLTDVSPIKRKENKVEFTPIKEGKFYYQGNLNDKVIPWDFSITYWLDDKAIAPEKLAGKNGHVKMKIAITQNEEANPIFFENYLLQISISLNTDRFTNIKAPEGTLANSGKSKQVSFTVLPGKEKEYVVDADVEKFELDGMTISAVPFLSFFELPNVDDLTDDIGSLSTAIEKVHLGVGGLNKGIGELNDGILQLQNGSAQYHDGITNLSHSSTSLVSASKAIENALHELNKALSTNTTMNMDDLNKLEDGLIEIANGLKETANGLTVFKDHYNLAIGTLNSAMEAIPEYSISEEDRTKLYSSNADKKVIEQLLETYAASQKAKGTYQYGKQAFEAVSGTLTSASNSLLEMENHLKQMAKELSSAFSTGNMENALKDLQEGVATLTANYQSFHSGLVTYTESVGILSNSYGKIHSGIKGLTTGTAQFKNGINELYHGTGQLNESTSNLPEEMNKEIDELLKEYDHSDFNPVSFVSTKNKNIQSVQFVFMTDSIKYDEKELTQKQKKEKKSIWKRFLDLFKFS